MSYRYELVVDGNEVEGYTAYLNETDSPLRGWGDKPLQAIRALCETIREWPIFGANQWLSKPEGVRLAREFVPNFEPPSGSSTKS